jgi:hypothetical protein
MAALVCAWVWHEVCRLLCHASCPATPAPPPIWLQVFAAALSHLSRLLRGNQAAGLTIDTFTRMFASIWFVWMVRGKCVLHCW